MTPFTTVEEEVAYLRGKTDELEKHLKNKSDLLISIQNQLEFRELATIFKLKNAIEPTWLDWLQESIRDRADLVFSDIEMSLGEAWVRSARPSQENRQDGVNR